jgi:hypothetical protein
VQSKTQCIRGRFLAADNMCGIDELNNRVTISAIQSESAEVLGPTEEVSMARKNASYFLIFVIVPIIKKYSSL